jgi:hypothetical protein
LRLAFIFTIDKIPVLRHRDPPAAKSTILKPRRSKQATKKVRVSGLSHSEHSAMINGCLNGQNGVSRDCLGIGVSVHYARQNGEKVLVPSSNDHHDEKMMTRIERCGRTARNIGIVIWTVKSTVNHPQVRWIGRHFNSWWNPLSVIIGTSSVRMLVSGVGAE